MSKYNLKLICESCGREELFPATEEGFQDADARGWDFPPLLGSYGVTSPRTCPCCGIDTTVWFRRMTEESYEPSPKDFETIKRISAEPASLFVDAATGETCTNDRLGTKKAAPWSYILTEPVAAKTEPVTVELEENVAYLARFSTAMGRDGKGGGCDALQEKYGGLEGVIFLVREAPAAPSELRVRFNPLDSEGVPQWGKGILSSPIEKIGAADGQIVVTAEDAVLVFVPLGELARLRPKPQR